MSKKFVKDKQGLEEFIKFIIPQSMHSMILDN